VAGATILPFPVLGGITAPPRPLPPSGADDNFAGVMDDALGAQPSARRDDTRRTGAAPRMRRSEPARPRDVSSSESASSSRRSSTPQRQSAAAERADDVSADDNAQRASERQDEAVAADVSTSTTDEQPKSTTVETGAAPVAEKEADAATAEAVESQAAAVEAEALAAMAAMAEEADGTEPGAGTTDVPEAKATAGQDEDAGETLTAAAERTRTAGTGLPQHAQASATARARAEVTAGPDDHMGELVKAAVHAAPETRSATASQPPQLASTAAEEAQTAANKATAAFAETASAGEAVESVEAETKTDVSDSGTQDQAQQRQAAPQSSRTPDTVAAATATPDGVRFSMNVAAGSAAYANATPRSEEVVLPQIVQHIRMHIAQGSSEARMQLKPEHLGALNIILKVEQGQVTATIQADVASVRQFIESHESSLRQALSEQGLQLAKLVVNPDGQQNEQDGREPNEQRRQERRRTFRDEDVTFEVLV
jgi:flagellar hook-length control protein FliK